LKQESIIDSTSYGDIDLITEAARRWNKGYKQVLCGFNFWSGFYVNFNIKIARAKKCCEGTKQVAK
jgi:hypothetical protein